MLNKVCRLGAIFALSALVFTGCTDSGMLEVSDEVDGSSASLQQVLDKYDFNPDDLSLGTFTVCKDAPEEPGMSFNFETTYTLGSPAAPAVYVASADLQDGQCIDVFTSGGGNGDHVKIMENLPDGWATPDLEVWTLEENKAPYQMPHDPGTEIEGSIEKGKLGCLVIFRNKKKPVPPPAVGRITGGGSIFTEGNMRVTHGFELHCNPDDKPNRLEINWQGNQFHLEELSTAVCTDDPEISERPPTAGFDTYEGTGVGRYNRESGYGIEFKLTDAGQPGRNDTATIEITAPDGTTQILYVSNNLRNGNQQTHRN